MRLDQLRTQRPGRPCEGISRRRRDGAQRRESCLGIERKALAQRLPAQRHTGIALRQPGHLRRSILAVHPAEHSQHQFEPAVARIARSLMQQCAAGEIVFAGSVSIGPTPLKPQ